MFNQLFYKLVGAITGQSCIWLPDTPWLGCGHGIFRGIKERSCGNLGGQLKKKWDLPECSRRTHKDFLWILVLTLEVPMGVIQFATISRGVSLFSLDFLKIK